MVAIAAHLGPRVAKSDLSARSTNRAIEIFARAMAFTRSFTYPAVAERFGKLWVIRDKPRKRPADYRREEWVAFGTAPAQVDSTARRHARGHFCICAVHRAGDPDRSLRTQYKALGYRLNATEAFMTHPLARIPTVPEHFPAQRVTTAELADRLAKAAGRRQI